MRRKPRNTGSGGSLRTFSQDELHALAECKDEFSRKADDARKRRHADRIRSEAATALNTTQGNSALLMPLLTSRFRVIKADEKGSVQVSSNGLPPAAAAYVEEVAKSIKFYGIDVTGIEDTDQLERAISRSHIKMSANFMKMAAENALRFVAAGSQPAACAQHVIATHATFLQAFEAGDTDAALGHFVDMHDAAGRLGELQVWNFVREGLAAGGRRRRGAQSTREKAERRNTQRKQQILADWASLQAAVAHGTLSDEMHSRACSTSIRARFINSPNCAALAADD
jgi:hypothetical protein